MAAQRHLDNQALRQHLGPFQLGELLVARPTSVGIANTHYEVTTTRGRYILRIMYDCSSNAAKFEEALLLRLVARGLTVPKMLGAGRRGHVLMLKPRQSLSVFRQLPGRRLAVFEVTPQHTLQLGRFLASMHAAAKGLGMRRSSRAEPLQTARLLARCQAAAAQLPRCSQAHVRLLSNELRQNCWERRLPQGVVHSNVTLAQAHFQGQQLCGIVNFEMAASGPYLYDLAVTLSDWAFLHDVFRVEHAAALLQGYAQVRPLQPCERQALYAMCRYAVTRQAVQHLYHDELHQTTAWPRPGCGERYPGRGEGYPARGEGYPARGERYIDYHHYLSRLAALQDMGATSFKRHVLETAAAWQP